MAHESNEAPPTIVDPEQDDVVGALDTIAGVLAGLSGDRPGEPDAFYDSLCEVVCRLTSIRRSTIFLWDDARRVVRAAGAFDVDISVFAGEVVHVDVLPAARQALERDEVVESRSHPQVEERFEHLVNDRRLVVVPMSADGTWLGVIIGDLLPDAPPVSDAERHLLWTLGKTAALAAAARRATHEALRAKELERRIDLAREIHDSVVQRLFGVSLALSGDGDLDAEARERCASELQAALQDLRDAVQRPLGRRSPETQATLAGELERLGREHADLGLRLVSGDPEDVPEHLQGVLQSVLVEALRNARKHARPEHVDVAIRHADGAVVLEVTNDGVEGRPRRSGMGLRLAALEALQHGGLLEFGPAAEGTWQVRLAVPDA